MSEQQSIGRRIRAFREERGLSIATLARDTGLSEGFLQKLEEDMAYPAIGPLQKIAIALEVRLGTFLDDKVTRDPVITRAADRPGDGDPAFLANSMPPPSYHYHLLGKGKSDRNMEPVILTITPTDTVRLSASSHQGEEFVYVLEGELLVAYGSERHILGPGDTIYYNSVLPHYVYSANGRPVRILAVTYNP